MVFKDEQIKELVKFKPKKEKATFMIKNFCEIKVEKYGEGILYVFNLYINSMK